MSIMAEPCSLNNEVSQGTIEGEGQKRWSSLNAKRML
jgi:hypothetical protein